MDESPTAPIQSPPATSQWGGEPLGPWLLRQVIGSGGMGQVWLATRSDGLYRGRAAVKVLHVANATPQANARFAREGELLARVAHPRIAQLYDVGLTPDGARFLVMEYVEGKPLDEACDARCLDIEARVELFLQVCEAVAYAHQQSIVHRDLKPSNILVTNEGHVKLLDFGVAKLMSHPPDAQELTRAGSPWFTLEYAAPEQLDASSITTATDVYSLGVLLYSLLCGTRPNVHVKNLSDAFRFLGEPLRPMHRAVALGDAVRLAASRSTAPAKLVEGLQGDLAVIVGKALKVEPLERYDTAASLGDDLRRYLRRLPVSARHDTWTYRTRKFIARNRVQVAAATAVSLTLMIGLLSTAWQWRNAEREARRANAAIDVLIEGFTPAALGKSPSAQASLVDVLGRTWRQTGIEFGNDPQTRARLALPLGLMLSTAGDMTQTAEALEVSRQYHVAAGLPPTRQYLTALLLLGTAKVRLMQFEEAKLRLRETIQTAELISSSMQLPRNALDEPFVAEVQLALIAQQEGHSKEARQQLEATVQSATRILGEDHDATVLARHELTNLLRKLGERVPGEVPPQTSADPELAAFAELSAATLDVEEGRFVAAVPRLQAVIAKLSEMLAPNDTHLIFARGWLSAALLGSGRYDESEATAQLAYRLALQSQEADVLPTTELVVARHYLRTQQLAKAEPLLRHSLEFFANAGVPGRHRAASIRASLGEWLVRSHRAEEGLALLEQADNEQRSLASERNYQPESYVTISWRAIAIDATRGAAAAQPYYAEARDVAARFRLPTHPDRLRLQLLVDYSAWRTAPASASRARLLESLRSYEDVLRQRPDFATVATLERKLLQSRSTEVLETLTTLMSY